MIFDIKEVKHHFILDNLWPAILLEDYSIRIMCRLGGYDSYEEYKITNKYFPYTQQQKDKLEEYYNFDWEKYYNTSIKENKFNNWDVTGPR